MQNQMNRYQEALKFLYENIDCGMNMYLDEMVGRNLEIMSELVDKAIPKKPYFLNYGGYKTGNWHCPECKGIINDDDMYCKHCGQKLSWKQNEDEKES